MCAVKAILRSWLLFAKASALVLAKPYWLESALLQIGSWINWFPQLSGLETENPVHQAYFSLRVSVIKWRSLSFTQCPRYLNSFNCGVSRLHGFESQRGADYPLQLSMIAFDNIVPVFNLPVLNIGWAFSLMLKLWQSPTICLCAPGDR